MKCEDESGESEKEKKTLEKDENSGETKKNKKKRKEKEINESGQRERTGLSLGTAGGFPYVLSPLKW